MMSRITRSNKNKLDFDEQARATAIINSDSATPILDMPDTKEPTLQDLMAEFKKNQEGNTRIQNQLNGLQTSVDTNTNTLQTHLKKYDEEIKVINESIEGLQASVNLSTDRMDAASVETKELKEDNKNLRKRLNDVENVSQKLMRQEEESKRRNIIIEGIKETSFLKTKDTVAELLTDVCIEMSPLTVVNLHRLGKQIPELTRPRPIKVIFLSNLTKQYLYKKISQLKDVDKWK